MNVTTPVGRFLVPPQRAVWIPPTIEHSIDVLTDIKMRSIYIELNWLLKHSKHAQLNKIYLIEVNTLLREAMLENHRSGTNQEKIELLVNLALLEPIEAKDGASFLSIPMDTRANTVALLAMKDIASSKDFVQLCFEVNASSRTITRLFNREVNMSFRESR